MPEVDPGRREPLVLTDGWRAAPADDELQLGFHEPDLDDSTWIPVELPSSWQESSGLDGAGGSVLYRCSLPALDLEDDERAWLVADGIFSEGDIWFDGHYLGDAEGYFVRHAAELDPNLLLGEDHVVALEVRHQPARDLDGKHAIVGTYDDPRLIDRDANPGGIWQPVSIVRTGPVRMSSLRVRVREATAAAAVLVVTATLDAEQRCEATFVSRVGGTDHDFEQPLTAGQNRVEWLIPIPEPDLWWPRGLGPQNLVDVTIGVMVDGRTSDSRTLRTGLRSVELRRWTLAVNGERLFTKGVNLGPVRPNLATTTEEDLEAVMALVLEANFDLVRLRGHIAHPALYDIADRLGILVWQDFPLYRGYSKRVRKRAMRLATEAVDLLAHHPSIALWCAHDTPTPDGADDPTVARARFGGARAAVSQILPTWNKSVLDRSVKQELDKADGTRAVIAHSGAWPHPPQLDGTDTHLWYGWRWGSVRGLERLAGRIPRAVRWVSEFGAASVPDNAEFCQPDRWPAIDFSNLADNHAYEKQPFEAHVPPGDAVSFDAWRTMSQRYQAQIVRRHIETLRRLKYHPTGGFCVDHLIDARPAITSSLVDHDFTPKLAFYAAKAACAPVIVVADRLPDKVRAGQALALDVHVVNDLRTSVAATVAAELRWPDGGGGQKQHRWTWQGHADADSVARVGTISWVAPDATGPLTLILAASGGATCTNRYDAELV